MKTRLFKMDWTRQSLGKWSLHRLGTLCTALCLLASMLVGLSGQVLAEYADSTFEDYVVLNYTETPMGSRLLPAFTKPSLGQNPASQKFMAKLQEVIQTQDENIAEIQAQAARENWD